MTYKKEEDQATGLQLHKNSEAELVKTYFSKVFELKQSGKQFPVSLDDVWPLIYERKDNAVKALKSDFVENEDYIIQKTENQVFRQNAESNSKRGGDRRTTLYFLSVECLEYFIVKKVKPVFEVYRQVFHKVVEGNTAQAKIAQFASRFSEETRIAVGMGESTTQVYVKSGMIYAKLSPIMRYLGYMGGSTPAMVNRLGVDNCIYLDDPKQPAWFINSNAFEELIRMTTLSPHPSIVYAIRRDVFGYDMHENVDPYTYKFTDAEMLQVVMEITKSPIKKSSVVELLEKGRR